MCFSGKIQKSSFKPLTIKNHFKSLNFITCQLFLTMAKLSEESLNKLTKPEQIAFLMNLQEKKESAQHDVKDEVRETRGRTGPI